MPGLSQQHLEVRHPNFVEVAHLRNGRLQMRAGALWSLGLQPLSAWPPTKV
jgi:hypothetical protein